MIFLIGDVHNCHHFLKCTEHIFLDPNLRHMDQHFRAIKGPMQCQVDCATQEIKQFSKII